MSFDCLAQEHQREKGSFKKIVAILKELLKHSNIDLEVNSVFTPITVGSLSDSMRFLIELGVSDINFSLSIIEPWEQSSILKLEKEMIKLRKLLLVHHERKANIPVIGFREDLGKGFFYCAGGKDRLALTPDEEIWGCQLFPDYFKGKEKSPEYKKFFFGTLGHFIKKHKNIYPRISSNYSQLSMDNCSTSNMDCFLCSELENCQVCPVNAAIASRTLCRIPSYVCKILKIKSKEIKKFRKELQKNNLL